MMKGMNGKHGAHRDKKDVQETLAEMMLARSVLEEKNELIDQKDYLIRELVTKLRASEAEIEDLHLELERSRAARDQIEEDERSRVLNAIVSDIVRVTADWSDLHGATPDGLASRILGLLRSEYDLQLIEEPLESIDPELHRVVVVEQSTDDCAAIEVLSNGYRLGDTVIRPALVKVVLGVAPEGAPRSRALSFIEEAKEEHERS